MKAFLALLTAAVLSGCAGYYVSGVQAGYEVTDTSKDGTISISIAPNPYSHGTDGKNLLPPVRRPAFLPK